MYLLKIFIFICMFQLISSAWSNSSNLAELEKLKEMLDTGYLTKEEFDEAKNKLFNKDENNKLTYLYNSTDIIVDYAGPEDVFPYGYPLALRCRAVPINIELSLKGNEVRGIVKNRYREFNNNISISDKECTTIHSGTFSGKIDKHGKFKKVFIKHPTSSFNLHGFYRLDGTIDNPKLTFKNNYYFKYEQFSFKKINNDLAQKKPTQNFKKDRNRNTLKKQSVISDTQPPTIGISSITVKDKQGTIEGIVQDNIEVAELKINDEEVYFYEKGNFEYSTFIPKDGKSVVIEVTDTKGLSSQSVLFLSRKNIDTNKKIEFTDLNPLKLKGKKNKNALALIIGISKYRNVPEAKYADRDANYFADFSENTLGINLENIRLVSNEYANGIEIKKSLKLWMKGYSTPNESDIFIFFAGHGLASTDGKELYLLPYDGEPRLLQDTSLLRSEIFDIIKSIKPKSVTVFLDACYSGQTREKDMLLVDARPISIVPLESDVPKNFTVFSASTGSEISSSLPEAEHGLFSYFLMKGLEGDADTNNDKKITNGELHAYIRSNVTKQAIRLGKEQTPQLLGDWNKVLVEFN